MATVRVLSLLKTLAHPAWAQEGGAGRWLPLPAGSRRAGLAADRQLCPAMCRTAHGAGHFCLLYLHTYCTALYTPPPARGGGGGMEFFASRGSIRRAATHDTRVVQAIGERALSGSVCWRRKVPPTLPPRRVSLPRLLASTTRSSVRWGDARTHRRRAAVPPSPCRIGAVHRRRAREARRPPVACCRS